MAASTTIVRAGDKSHKFSWDLINQANPSQGPLEVKQASIEYRRPWFKSQLEHGIFFPGLFPIYLSVTASSLPLVDASHHCLCFPLTFLEYMRRPFSTCISFNQNRYRSCLQLHNTLKWSLHFLLRARFWFLEKPVGYVP